MPLRGRYNALDNHRHHHSRANHHHHRAHHSRGHHSLGRLRRRADMQLRRILQPAVLPRCQLLLEVSLCARLKKKRKKKRLSFFFALIDFVFFLKFDY
jgi:hypothetical protein